MKRLVKITTPKICVHSDTTLPTTWPHLLPVSILAKSTTQPIPVTSKKILKEWSRRSSRAGLSGLFGSRRLSAEFLSYKYFVAKSITTTPDQSAIAFPKNERSEERR